MVRLTGRWKTGQKIMDNLNLLSYKLKTKNNISPTCAEYIFDIEFAGTKGEMHIYTEFGEILEKTYMNCGFDSDLTLKKDRTLLFVAEHLLNNIKRK